MSLLFLFFLPFVVVRLRFYWCSQNWHIFSFSFPPRLPFSHCCWWSKTMHFVSTRVLVRLSCRSQEATKFALRLISWNEKRAKLKRIENGWRNYFCHFSLSLAARIRRKQENVIFANCGCAGLHTEFVFDKKLSRPINKFTVAEARLKVPFTRNHSSVVSCAL